MVVMPNSIEWIFDPPKYIKFFSFIHYSPSWVPQGIDANYYVKLWGRRLGSGEWSK